MRFDRVEIQGFGRLVNRSFDFAPCLNLIVGPNEAGKSTLELALFSLLYGFFDEGKVSNEMRAALRAARPWNRSAPYAGSLQYRLDNGEGYRVTRTFAPKPTTVVQSHPGWKDVSSRYVADRDGRLYFAEAQLGVTREVFRHACFVYQSEILALDHSADAITNALTGFASSGTGDTTAHQALDVLEQAIRNEVGTDRSWTKPLYRARQRVETLEAERREAEHAHRALLEAASTLRARTDEMGELELEGERLAYLALVTRRAVAAQQIEALSSDDEEIARWEEEVARHAPWRDFPAQQRDEVVQLVARRRDLRTGLEGGHQAAADAAAELDQLAAERHALEMDARELEDARDTDTARLGDIKDLESRWQHAQSACESTEKELGEVEARLAQKEQPAAAERARLARALEVGSSTLAILRQQLAVANGHMTEAETAFHAAAATSESLRHEAGLAGSWRDVDWSRFPAHLANDIDSQANRRRDLQARVAESAPAAERAARELERVTQEQAELQPSLHAAPADAASTAELQVLVDRWRIEHDRLQSLEERRHALQQELEQAEFEGARERRDLDAACKIGLAGIAALHQRWASANQRVSQTHDTLQLAESDWQRVGVDDARYRQLEQTARAYQAGKAPAATARRGCFGMFRRGTTAGQAPSDVTIYADIRPIRERYLSARDAQNAAREEREIVLREIREGIGALLGSDPPTDAAFRHLAARLEAHLVVERTTEGKRRERDAVARDVDAARSALQGARDSAACELDRLGVSVSSPAAALDVLAQLSQRREEQGQARVQSERLRVEEQALRHEIATHAANERGLQESTAQLLSALDSAGIDCPPALIDRGVEAFRAAIDIHRRWSDLQHAREEQSVALAAVTASLGELAGDPPTENALARLADDLDAYHAVDSALDGDRLLLQRVKDRLASLQDEADEARRSLADALRGAGLESTDPARGVQLFAERCERRARLDATEQRLSEIALRQETLQRDVERHREQETSLAQVQEELRQILASSGIAQQDLDAGVAAFEEACISHARWREAVERRDRAEGVRQARAASGDAVSQEAVQEWDTQIARALEQHPNWADLAADQSPDAYEELAHENEVRRGDLRHEIAGLEHEMRRLAEHRHLAAIDEEIGLAQAEVARLTRLRDDLERARRSLAAALEEFQKQFAPQLEIWLGEGLARLTRGRYRDAGINPATLAVSVASSEARTSVDTAQLSSATRDAVYLMLRVAIARFMSRGGESLPLLLDDPFIRLDERRQEQALDYLSRLAEEAQILLFTKDVGLAGWFEERFSRDSRHRLIALEDVLVAAAS